MKRSFPQKQPHETSLLFFYELAALAVEILQLFFDLGPLGLIVARKDFPPTAGLVPAEA